MRLLLAMLFAIVSGVAAGSPAALAVKAPSPSPTSGDCGLGAYPVNRPNKKILADAPLAARPSSSLLAKLQLGPDGQVTHLRVLRRAYPEAPKAAEPLNLKAIQDLKDRHFPPATVAGQPVVACVEIAVTIDLR